MKKISEFKIPDEFNKALNDHTDLKSAFNALTSEQPRGYLLYFWQAKHSKIRESRIEKSIQIFEGKGLNDNFKK